VYFGSLKVAEDFTVKGVRGTVLPDKQNPTALPRAVFPTTPLQHVVITKVFISKAKIAKAFI